ncbi:SsgA family sporulation/cell division regulator [Nonomuraea sp. NPDC050556]|uniref:SsgA family sporulation/cell division regulator n=1 Tax=Nonomuraea sp. NPDC050556 TaxID=3364369 RepID=UPI0037B2610A
MKKSIQICVPLVDADPACDRALMVRLAYRSDDPFFVTLSIRTRKGMKTIAEYPRQQLDDALGRPTRWADMQVHPNPDDVASMLVRLPGAMGERIYLISKRAVCDFLVNSYTIVPDGGEWGLSWDAWAANQAAKISA